MARLYLASQSPRRRDLLQQIGVPFELLSVAVNESPFPAEAAHTYVERLARDKALAGLATLDAALEVRVLGADTSVVLDGRILGKPSGYEMFRDMLAALSGRSHRVLTGIALASAERCEACVVTCTVHFRSISAMEIEAYWQSGEPLDKAGGYAIQGLGAVFVDGIQGSYSAVVGLPLCETAALLKRFGIDCWQTSGHV